MRLLLVGALLAITSPARAEGFVEGDFGLLFPILDEDYQNNVDPSAKLGVRVGSVTKFGGVDFGLDYTPFNDSFNDGFGTDVTVQRFRFHLGVRYHHPITPKATLFARLGAGLDLIHYSASGGVGPFTFETSETDPGFALDFSAGVLFDLGKLKIGAKIGLPMAFHFDGDDPADPDDADLEYTALDLDLAFVVSIPF